MFCFFRNSCISFTEDEGFRGEVNWSGQHCKKICWFHTSFPHHVSSTTGFNNGERKCVGFSHRVGSSVGSAWEEWKFVGSPQAVSSSADFIGN